jgi:D-lactate dehydrogenase
MKILYLAQEEWEEAFVKNKLPEDEVTAVLGSLEGNAAFDGSEVEALSVFVNSRIGAAEMDRFPKLKYIATQSTGFDHIDFAEAAKRGITVSNVPSYGVNTVAEFAFALILALSRRICEANDRVSKEGSFSQADLQGFDLAGKTLGIVGMGHIGVYAARMAKGFGMNILVFDVHPDPALAAEIGFSYCELDDLLSRSDIITLHVPYNPHTHHLMDAERLAKVKRGAYLINTARGAVVDTAALIAALENGTLAGAGLDVLEEEDDMQDERKLFKNPTPSAKEAMTVLENRYLMQHQRVIVTPHIAFDTKEAVERILDTTVENLRAFSAGAPINVVQPKP